MMYGRGKSDEAIVALKPANKAERSAAEQVERRAEAKGNVCQRSRAGLSTGLGVLSSLVRMRTIASAMARLDPRWKPYAGKLHVRSSVVPVVSASAPVARPFRLPVVPTSRRLPGPSVVPVVPTSAPVARPFRQSRGFPWGSARYASGRGDRSESCEDRSDGRRPTRSCRAACRTRSAALSSVRPCQDWTTGAHPFARRCRARRHAARLRAVAVGGDRGGAGRPGRRWFSASRTSSFHCRKTYAPALHSRTPLMNRARRRAFAFN